jgi:hypothetical protein
LRRWAVFGVERGQPLHTRAAMLLVYEGVAHDCRSGRDGGGFS